MEDQQQTINDQTELIRDLITGFEEKFRAFEVVAPLPDLTEVNSVLTNGLSKIQQTLEKKPVPIIRQFRLLLFPETNTDYYYKITFGRILPWFVAALIAGYLFTLGQQWVEEWQTVRQQEIETNISARAWDNLYKKANGKDRKMLERLITKRDTLK